MEKLEYTLPKVEFYKAILPIFIILHHLSFFYDFPPGFEKLGLPIVACFFTMSGYGLMTSYLKKSDKYLSGFIRYTADKLFTPYLLALLAYLPVRLIYTNESLYAYVCKTSFDDWLQYSWFVFVIWGGILHSS